MRYADLRDFLRDLERDGDLPRVKAPVDPHLEVDRDRRAGRPRAGPGAAVREPDVAARCRWRSTCSAPSGGWRRRSASSASTRSATGSASCSSRSCRTGWSRPPRRASARSRQLRAVPPKKVQDRALPGGRAHAATRSTSTGCPACRPGPSDGGVFLNLGLTHTKHPETGARNLGLYRLQQHDQQHGRHALADPQGLHRPPRGRRAARRAAAGRDRLRLRPGGHLRRVRAAARPTSTSTCSPASCSGERVEMVDCLTVPLQVPANAQVVLEGWLEPGERLPEGPFGDHTGFYTPVEPFPVLHVDVHDDADATRSTRPSSSAGRRRRTARSARPPSGSSCR